MSSFFQPPAPPPPPKVKEESRSAKLRQRMYGHLKLIQRVRGSTKQPWKKELWRMECVCGKRITVPRHYLFRKVNPKTHCGCQFKSIKTHHNREYRIWLMMHERCYNAEHISYKHYGAKGIAIAQVFRSAKHGGDAGDIGFDRFIKEVGPNKNRAYSIDRINGSKGYEPGNLRWATYKEQAANQGGKIQHDEQDEEAEAEDPI